MLLQIEAKQDVDFDEIALKALEGAKKRKLSLKKKKNNK